MPAKRKDRTSYDKWIEKKMKNPDFRAGREEARLALMLARAREDLGLTQGQLARKVHMTQPEVARIESGAHNPTVETVARIASALGKRVELV